jgi:uncharacterized membrane protein
MSATLAGSPGGAMESVGRVFMASLLVVVGVQHFLYAGFIATLIPAWFPTRLFLAYFVGVAFFAAAVGILIEKVTRPAGTLLGVMFLVFVVTTHLPRIVMHSRNGNEWTSGLVALAMCGGAWIVANTSRRPERGIGDPFLKLGPYLFAIAMVGFGIQHFIDARLTARVGPPWYPGRPLWAYLTGAALIMAGAAIVVRKGRLCAGIFLGAMMLGLFLFLHLPRIVAAPRKPGPWTSGFEILAMCGAALALAGKGQKEE